MSSLPATRRPATNGFRLGRRGSALAAALAICFLVFAITVASLTRVAGYYARVSARHSHTAALYCAEAGVAWAGAQLAVDRGYRGGRGAIATGAFDVTVTPERNRYNVISTGYAASPLKNKPRKRVATVITMRGDTPVVSNWRQDP